MSTRKYLFLLLFTSLLLTADAASDPSIRLTPNLSVGYTFGKGLNAGVGMGVGLLNYQLGDLPSYAGFSCSYAIFSHERKLYKNGFYRVFSIQLMNVVDELQITRLGFAKTKLKWGVNNVNSSFSNGWGLDVDLAVRPIWNAPLLGFRYFRINNVCMGIGATNPKFLYVGYQYPIVLNGSQQAAKPEVK